MLKDELKKTRELLQLTQKEFANLTYLEQSTISKYETGEREISDYYVLRIMEEVLKYKSYYLCNKYAKDKHGEKELETKILEKVRGRISNTNIASDYDLFLASKKHQRTISVFQNEENTEQVEFLYNSMSKDIRNHLSVVYLASHKEELNTIKQKFLTKNVPVVELKPEKSEIINDIPTYINRYAYESYGREKVYPLVPYTKEFQDYIIRKKKEYWCEEEIEEIEYPKDNTFDDEFYYSNTEVEDYIFSKVEINPWLPDKFTTKLKKWLQSNLIQKSVEYIPPKEPGFRIPMLEGTVIIVDIEDISDTDENFCNAALDIILFDFGARNHKKYAIYSSGNIDKVYKLNQITINQLLMCNENSLHYIIKNYDNEIDRIKTLIASIDGAQHYEYKSDGIKIKLSPKVCHKLNSYNATITKRIEENQLQSLNDLWNYEVATSEKLYLEWMLYLNKISNLAAKQEGENNEIY